MVTVLDAVGEFLEGLLEGALVARERRADERDRQERLQDIRRRAVAAGYGPRGRR